MSTNATPLTPHDPEQIERVMCKQADDIAVSIARSFERLEEWIDSAESRLHSRLAGLDDTVETFRESLADEFGTLRGELRDHLAADAPAEKF